MLKHLAIIMDGNRRWAKERSLAPWKGHEEGMVAVERAVNFCLEKNISYLTLYAFSLENLHNRSSLEQQFLFGPVADIGFNKVAELEKQKVRIRFIGDRSLFPATIKNRCDEIEKNTAHHTKLTLSFCLCYGSRQEIVAAARACAQQLLDGTIKSVNDITVETMHRTLWTGDMPDPDLIMRTGGAQRLSNYLLFQAAYSELYFLDCYWPEVTDKELQVAYDYFIACKRNFGA